MPPNGAGRRRTRDELEDDEANSSDTSSAASATSDTLKRPRLHDRTNNDDDDDSNASLNDMGEPRVGRSVDPGDYHPGSIIRVTVENFVTYEKAEFFPGPNLNMVIGPNGTGKSSLVCAICLGLGYSPKHLGRAGSVKEFVKHGKDIAIIEIELCKRPQDRSNFVVRVQIRREQNSQKWWLNGKETNHKAVQNLTRTLKIQVDNLCQFLPQDRVVEFAACTPIDLLHETLRAAAPEQMIEWQEQLQGLQKDKKELNEAVRTDTETLSNLENRQQGLQADVDRIREREEIEVNVKNLKSAQILARYQEARAKYADARARQKEAERSLKNYQSEVGPSLEAVNRKEGYVRKVAATIPRSKVAASNAEKHAVALARQVSVASEKVKEFDNKLDVERKSFEAKKKELAVSRQKLTQLQADQKNQPPAFDATEWNRRIRAEEHVQRELDTEKRQAETQMRELRNQASEIRVEVEKLKGDLQLLETQEGQQLNFMKRNFPDLAAGWEWIQQHQSEFEQEVFGPPMVSCSVKDERYSDQVQALLRDDDFTCFTAQNIRDHKKLSTQFYKNMSLSVVIRTCSSPLGSFERPASREDAQRFGLDGFAIDFVDGPSPVLAMLCAERGLHRSGVSLEDHTDAQYEHLVRSGAVMQWAAGKQSYIVRRRREYGPQAMTTVTKNIQPGRYWSSQPVDTQERAELERRMEQLHTERRRLKAEYDALDENKTSLEERMDKIAKTIDDLKTEKVALQKEHQKWLSIPDKIASEESNKANIEEAMRERRATITELQYEWDEAVITRAQLAIEHARTLEDVSKAHQAILDCSIQLIEAESDVEGLKLRNAGIMESLEAEKRNVAEAKQEREEAASQGKEMQSAVEQMFAADPEMQPVLTGLCEGKSSEELQIEAEAEEAKLELIHAANPNVMREFERRASEIARLRKKMEGSTEKLRRLTEQTEALMSRWEPRLDELVDRISEAFAYNFEQISCAGEVRVHKDADFDLWALDIMVKFRENEELQQLNAHRQSGGERAVSTIFFLMALQSLAQSPFRVVDEINQGMDPRNERMVHERMVEIACREHTSQYFLITPKLLTGLRYDPKMRVLCIASGEHMPREGRKLDFKRCLRVQKALMAATA